MRMTAFRPEPLPGRLAERLLPLLRVAHEGLPFSAAGARATVRRVAEIAAPLGVQVRVFRGGVDLGPFEADHVWLSVEGRVLDVALPVFDRGFVDALGRFVAGELDAPDLDAAAARTALDDRVIGEFPASVRYLGSPVWTERRR